MIRHALCLSALVCALCAASFAQQAPKTQLKVGDPAPDFTLVKLSDFRGKKNVVLAFYILAFTGG